MSPHVFVLVIVVLTCNHLAHAARGSRATVINNSTVPLRLVQDIAGAYPPARSDIIFLLPGALHQFSGNNEGLNGEYDVSFTVERFCPGLYDSPISMFTDGWAGAAHIAFMNPWARAYWAKTFFTSTHVLPTDNCFAQVQMACKEWPPQNGCRISNKFDDMDENTSQSLDYPAYDYLNSIQGTVTRTADTPDYKEWSLTINAPPKACINDMKCATDWRAPYCNAQ